MECQNIEQNHRNLIGSHRRRIVSSYRLEVRLQKKETGYVAHYYDSYFVLLGLSRDSKGVLSGMNIISHGRTIRWVPESLFLWSNHFCSISDQVHKTFFVFGFSLRVVPFQEFHYIPGIRINQRDHQLQCLGFSVRATLFLGAWGLGGVFFRPKVSEHTGPDRLKLFPNMI